MKTALCMIVKGTYDSAPLLDKCLKSVHKHVDGIFLQLNIPKGKKVSPAVREVAEKYTKHIEVADWTGNFAKARNLNFAQVPKDYDFIMWLDADDTVEHPEKIREVCAVIPNHTHGVYILYDYQHDEWGNPIVSHWSCRIVRNNGSFTWKSSFDDEEVSVHETLVPVRHVKQASNEEFKIIHHADNQRRNESLLRNIALLEGMYDRHLDNPDPRILFYLATHYYDVGNYEGTKQMLYQYLQLSGWAEERSEAHVFMGRVYNNYRQPAPARTAFLMALGENPKNQSALLELAKLEFKDQQYGKAVQWLETAEKIDQGPQAMVLFSGHYELYMLLAESLANLGGKSLSKALKWAQKALNLRPRDPEAKEKYEQIENLVNYQKDMRAVVRIIRKLRDEPDKLLKFLDAVPKDLADSPVVVSAKHEHLRAKQWPKNSIAIMCGGSPLGIWGPWSLKEGIGGSEEAVIRLSSELVKLGWQVVVYATPGERAGIYDGIEWKQYWEFNQEDDFDVVVAWRMPSFFDMEVKARKKYLWLHDVMEKEEFTNERLNRLDKVIVLSRYHRSLFPMLPPEKVYLSANGITPGDFSQLDGRMARDPHRIIYMSSHIRGLALLYDIWPDVKKAVPEASLDIYYGWESYVNMNHDNPGHKPGGMGWMRMMQDWIKKLDGVTDHGKISQPQIVEEIFKSGVWAYPCPFPEIYCITAIKAQAGGAIPISSDFAALDETVQYGTKIHMAAQDEDTPVGKWKKEDVTAYKKALIDMLKSPDKQSAIRGKMMAWARTQSWEAVAKAWTEEFRA